MSDSQNEFSAMKDQSSNASMKTQSARGSGLRHGDDEITFSEIFAVLRGGRWMILAITCGFAVIALSLALILPKEYRATILVSPVSANDASGKLAGLANAVPGVSSIASMFGISSHSGDAAKDVATLESQILTRKFITANDLMPILFAKSWNAKTNSWRVTSRSKTPTLWKANLLFKKKVRTVALDEKTGLIKMSIVWSKPELAANWANGLVAMANEYLRTRAIKRADREIKYLGDEAQKTSDVTVRRGIYEIMQQEIANEMVARGQRQYAMRVIDPAFAPEVAASPRPILWTLSGLIGGFLLSCGWVMLRATQRESH